MHSAKFFSKQTLTLGVMLVLGGGAVLIAPTAQAATFTLDFGSTGFDGAGEALNPHDLDDSDGQLLMDGTYGTSTGASIGTIWSDLGITITGYDNDYIDNPAASSMNANPLGLFKSDCIIGTANNAANTTKCQKKIGGKTFGDNDLATGVTGDVFGIPWTSSTTPNLGNLLIFEENPGNSAPDDTASGGTFVFDFDPTKNWAVESISVVDDADVTIKYFYKDGTPATTEEMGTVPGDNDITFFTGAQSRAISKIAVQFENSGGIGGIRLKEIEEVIPTIPEPTAGLGLIAFGAVAAHLKRKPQGADN